MDGHLLDVLVRVSAAARKHHDQKKQVGEERVYSSYTSILLFINKGSQDRNSIRAGTWRQELIDAEALEGLLTGLHLVACSACFLIAPRTTFPGMALPTMGWGPPTSITK